MCKLSRIWIFLVAFFCCISCTKLSVDQSFRIYCYTDEVSSDESFVMAKSVVGYGFYADTANYAVKSYSEAIAGNISNRLTSAVKESDIVGQFDSESGIVEFKNLTKEGYVILVLCDSDNKIYAYKEFEVAPILDSVVVNMTFEIESFAANPDTVLLNSGWIEGGDISQ